MTYTLALMEVPKEVHALIRAKLVGAGYASAIQWDGTLDMTHIGLTAAAPLTVLEAAVMKGVQPSAYPMGGHGHVWATAAKARCGGPGMCQQCAVDQAWMLQRGVG
jgi:hypothetical protein